MIIFWFLLYLKSISVTYCILSKQCTNDGGLPKRRIGGKTQSCLQLAKDQHMVKYM